MDNATNALAAPAPPQASTLYHSPDAERFAMEQRMANLFVKSGLFGDIKGQSPDQSIAQAYVKIALGYAMGFSPAESMQGIDVIQGRPAVSAQLRAARMQRNGFTWSIDRLDNKGCEMTIFHKGQNLGKVSFLEEDAKMAKLADKDNWKKDPSSMYFARTITRAQRRFAPGVLSADVVSTDEAWDLPPMESRPSGVQQPRRLQEVKQNERPADLVRFDDLETQNSMLFWQVMGSLGHDSVENIPADQRDTVYAMIETQIREATDDNSN